MATNQALAHFPRFHANGAWTVLGALAHNLLRWNPPDDTPTYATATRESGSGADGVSNRSWHAKAVEG